MNWPLRVGLIAALAALSNTSSILASTSSLPSPNSSSVRNSATTTIGTGTKVTTSTSPTTLTTVPGAYSGPITRSAVGHGCGFSLALTSATARGTAGAISKSVGRCTILEIGDSLGSDLGWGLTRHLSATSGLNLIQLDKPSTGLANSWFYDWPVHLAADLKQYHPQLVLVFLGGNDEQGMTVNGSVVSFGTAAWEKDYLGYVRQTVTEATTSGAYVMWIGPPVMQPTSYSQGMAILDSVYKKGVTSEQNATFVPTWALFSNPDGQFESAAAVNGVETTLRQSDGIHFSFSGEDVVATYIIREMALVYHVKLVPTSPSVITHWG